MTANLLVTGVTGLVGRHFACRALEAGYRVTAIVRPESDRSVVSDLPIQFVEADLSRPESFEPALADAEIVVHAAAHVGDWGPAEKYRAINVIALDQLLYAAQRSGRLRRWIQISSLGVYPARHHYGTDETTPADPHGLDGYTRTKAEAEAVIHRHQRDHALPAVILRPGFIYGAGDRHALPRIIEKIEAGKMKFLGRGDRVLNNTAVENLCDAILLAIENQDALGETFNIRDKRLVTREEFINTVADYLGKPHPRHLPEWLGRALVGPIETIARLRGRQTPPLLTGAQIKFLTLNLDFSIAKARSVLGYDPRVDFREGIRRALDYATGKTANTPACVETPA